MGGWERLDSDCVAAYAPERPKAIGVPLDRRFEAMSGKLPANADVAYVADIVEDTPS
jgi:hypothetical protein